MTEVTIKSAVTISFYASPPVNAATACIFAASSPPTGLRLIHFTFQLSSNVHHTGTHQRMTGMGSREIGKYGDHSNFKSMCATHSSLTAPPCSQLSPFIINLPLAPLDSTANRQSVVVVALTVLDQYKWPNILQLAGEC